jgi:hypothetical protein
VSRYVIVCETVRELATGPASRANTTERIELDSSEATCHAGEHALFVHTNPDGLGGFQDERVIPWHRIIDYRRVES